MRESPESRMGIELTLPVKGIILRLDTFQNQGNSLAYADAHGAQRVFSLCAQELVERRGDKARAAGSQRMTDGDGTAIWIHVRRVVWNSQFAQDSQCLRCEGFVQLDHVHLRQRQTGFG